MNFPRRAAIGLIRRFLVFVASDAEAQRTVRTLFEPPTAEGIATEQPMDIATETMAELSAVADTEMPSAIIAAEVLSPNASFVDDTISESVSVELNEEGEDLPTDGDSSSPRFSEMAGFAVRFRLKAEGCRWSKKRTILRQNGANHTSEIAPTDREIIQKARQIGCLLWMNTPFFHLPDDPEDMDILAEWFDVAALACEVAGLLSSYPEAKRLQCELFPLLAEAQSGLRFAVYSIAARRDPDQCDFFHAVRDSCADQDIFVIRFLKSDDAPELDSASDLQNRIERLRQRIVERQSVIVKRRKLLGKLRYQLRSGLTERDLTDFWPTVASTVDQLMENGVPPSDLELRRLLTPSLSQIPDGQDWPRGFQLCVRELQEANRRGLTVSDENGRPALSPAVKRVRRWLAGRKVVLIGGDQRPLRKLRIEKAFGLSELIWIETKHGDSPSLCEPSIAQAEVAVVLLAIRWVSHGHADVNEYCRVGGKPLVRLPAGYGVNQIAEQIISQCSDRLIHQRRGGHVAC